MVGGGSTFDENYPGNWLSFGWNSTAQNFQQRALFACDVAAEASLLVEKPDYAKYAMGSRSMRDQLLAELEATRHAETFA